MATSFASVAAAAGGAGGRRNQKRKLNSSLSSTSSNGSSTTGGRRVAAFQAPPADMVMSSASPSPESIANMSLEAKQRAGAVDTMLPVKSLSADLAASAIDGGLGAKGRGAGSKKGQRQGRSTRGSTRSRSARAADATVKAKARASGGSSSSSSSAAVASAMQEDGSGSGGAVREGQEHQQEQQQEQQQQLLRQLQPTKADRSTGREDGVRENLERQMRNMLSLQGQLRQLTLSIDNLQFAFHHAKKNENSSASSAVSGFRGELEIFVLFAKIFV